MSMTPILHPSGAIAFGRLLEMRAPALSCLPAKTASFMVGTPVPTVASVPRIFGLNTSARWSRPVFPSLETWQGTWRP